MLAIRELYLKKASFLHGASVWTKVLFFLVVAPFCAFVAPIAVLLLLALTLAASALLGKIAYRTIWHHSRVYLVFAPSVTVILAFFFAEGPWETRLAAGALYGSRFIIAVVSAVLFTLTTSAIDVPMGLMAVKVPHRFGVTLMVAIRMLPMVSRRFSAIAQAQKARGAGVSLRLAELPRLPRHLTSFVVPSVLATLEASVALADTLMSRGYDPRGRVTVPPQAFVPLDLVILVAACFFLGITFMGN